jgi:hypothetical protein
VTVIDLSPDAVDAIAERVVELLRGEPVSGTDLVDAAEIASRFGVSRDYVYAHAERLGAVRLGDGPKARLRFDPATVAEALAAPRVTAGNASPARPRRQRRHAQAGGVDLLPVRGRQP